MKDFGGGRDWEEGMKGRCSNEYCDVRVWLTVVLASRVQLIYIRSPSLLSKTWLIVARNLKGK